MHTAPMSLKRELERAGSPIRTFFAERLPLNRTPRDRYKAAMSDVVTTLPVAVTAGGPLRRIQPMSAPVL